MATPKRSRSSKGDDKVDTCTEYVYAIEAKVRRRYITKIIIILFFIVAGNAA